MADFIHIKKADITIITNKVTFSLNLQTIKKYVKYRYFLLIRKY